MILPDFLAQDADGYIHLSGHRIGIQDVVDFYNQGYSPEMLLEQYPTLTLPLLHKTIAFYLESQAEVDAYIAQCDREIDKQRAMAKRGPNLDELRRRMKARIMMIISNQPQIVMEEVTDPVELAKARAQDERFARNSAWLQGHAKEVYTRYRGKCICVAGEELFVADTPQEAYALAAAAHPEDDGSFVRYIPREKVARIYAN
jgi:uncharacterized protein (DUF433 family)